MAKDEENKKDAEIELIPDEEGDLPDLQKKTKKLKDELKKCEGEKKEYLDGWQRSKADFINYKKDETKRAEEMVQFLSVGLIDELLPVLDSFDLAVGHNLPPEIERGVLLIRSQFEDILKKRGLEPIKIGPDEQFNPERHESVGEEESDKPLGAIIQEIQKGYLFRGRVLRPARVKISKFKN